MVFIAVIVLAVAGVWIAWGLRYGQELGINPVIVGALGTIMVGTVFGHTFYNINVGPIPLTLDRVLLGGVCLLFAFRFFFYRERIRSLDWTDLVVLGLLGLLTASTMLHDWKYRDNFPVSQLLFFNILPVTLYLVLKNCQISRTDIRILFVGFGLFAVYLSLTAFAETRGWHFAIFPRYISDPDVHEFLGRGRGPLHNPVANGLLILSGCFSCMMLMPQLRLNNWFWLAFVSVCAFVCCIGVWATLTRIIWFSLCLGVALFFWAAANPRYRRVLICFGLLAAFSLVVVMKSGALNNFKRDKHVSRHDMSKSAGLRYVFLVVAMDMIEDSPLMGHGFGQYRKVRVNYTHRLDHAGTETHLATEYIQHNILLSYLTETGLLGATMLLILLGTLAWIGWQLWSDTAQPLAFRQAGLVLLAFVIVYFAAGMAQDVTVIPMCNMLLFFWAGIGSNLYRSRFEPLLHRETKRQEFPESAAPLPV